MTALQKETVDTLVSVFCSGGDAVLLSSDERSPVRIAVAAGAAAGLAEPASGDETNGLRDTVILNDGWVGADLVGRFGCRTRREFYAAIAKTVREDGQILLVAENPFYVRNLGLGIPVLASFMRRNKSGQTFLRQHVADLRRAGFGSIVKFMIYPDVANIRHLVSTHRTPYMDFMSLTYRQTPRIPRDPRRWPVWMAIHLGLGRMFFPCQLIWARR